MQQQKPFEQKLTGIAVGLMLSLGGAVFAQAEAPAPAPAAEPPAVESPAPAPTDPPATPPDPAAPVPDAPLPVPAAEAPLPAPAPETAVPAPVVPEEAVPPAEQPALPDFPKQAPLQPLPPPPAAAGPDGQQIFDPKLMQNAQAVMAERFAEMAQSRLRAPEITPAMWEQAAALFKAARDLDPADPRYSRLLYEVALKQDKMDEAIESLTAYRKLVPNDMHAQIQQIDLYVGSMQAVDLKLKYLAGNEEVTGLLQKESLPPEIRSHVAYRCVSLLLDRNRDAAMKMLERSLELNPLNTAALTLKYSMLPPGAPAAERAAVLLARLRANPAQADALTELADLLAAQGLGSKSIRWYNIALQIFPRTGQPFPEGFIANHTTQFFLADQAESAVGLLTQYLATRPYDADAWVVRLAIEKTLGEKADKAVVDAAREAMIRQWMRVDDQINAREPVVDPNAGADRNALPPAIAADPAASIAKLKAADAPPEHRAAFVSALSDLAWLELYFANDQEAAARWITALSEVLPAENITIARLNGWAALLKGDSDNAKKLLEPIGKSDAIAAAGLLRLSTDKASGDAEANRLLVENRDGVIGALLWGELKARGVKPPPPAADTAAVADLVAKFPDNLLNIFDQPQAFYAVRAQPFKIAHKYREPIYVRVSIQNVGQHDLTLGPDGLIRSDLWFDVQLAGLANRNLSGVAFERLGGPLVLKPGETTAPWLVRFDQGPLVEVLSGNPGQTIQMHGFTTLNPVTTPQGAVPGPAGQRVRFLNVVVRTGFNIGNQNALQKVINQIQAGVPMDQIMGLDLLSTYVKLINNAQNQDAQMRALSNQLVQTIEGARGAMPIVAWWAQYNLSQIYADPLKREQTIMQMAADGGWIARLLAVDAAASLPEEKQKDVLKGMAERDPEAVLQRYAKATLYRLEHPATQPTTAPATAEEGAAPVPAANTETPGLPPADVVPAPSVPGADSGVPSELSAPVVVPQ